MPDELAQTKATTCCPAPTTRDHPPRDPHAGSGYTLNCEEPLWMATDISACGWPWRVATSRYCDLSSTTSSPPEVGIQILVRAPA
jgi:hypothetical protein